MGKIQVHLPDELSDALNELRKFDKGTFVELAVRQALQTDEIVKRFKWKNKPSLENNCTVSSSKNEETTITKSVKIDDDFK